MKTDLQYKIQKSHRQNKIFSGKIFSGKIFSGFAYICIFSIFTVLAFSSCSDIEKSRYQELIQGHFASSNKTHRMDLVFGKEKVVVIIDMIGLTIEKKYKFIENNEILLIDGFYNYHKINFIDENTFELQEDTTRKAKRKSPLSNNRFQRLKE